MDQTRVPTAPATSRAMAFGLRPSRRLAAVASCLAVLAALVPGMTRAQEYPWCVMREGYLYCFYQTQQQCQWAASGQGGGCDRNPRLLFPEKPRDSFPAAADRPRDGTYRAGAR